MRDCGHRRRAAAAHRAHFPRSTWASSSAGASSAAAGGVASAPAFGATGGLLQPTCRLVPLPLPLRSRPAAALPRCKMQPCRCQFSCRRRRLLIWRAAHGRGCSHAAWHPRLLCRLQPGRCIHAGVWVWRPRQLGRGSHARVRRTRQLGGGGRRLQLWSRACLVRRSRSHGVRRLWRPRQQRGNVPGCRQHWAELWRSGQQRCCRRLQLRRPRQQRSSGSCRRLLGGWVWRLWRPRQQCRGNRVQLWRRQQRCRSGQHGPELRRARQQRGCRSCSRQHWAQFQLWWSLLCGGGAGVLCSSSSSARLRCWLLVCVCACCGGVCCGRCPGIRCALLAAEGERACLGQGCQVVSHQSCICWPSCTCAEPYCPLPRLPAAGGFSFASTPAAASSAAAAAPAAASTPAFGFGGAASAPAAGAAASAPAAASSAAAAGATPVAALQVREGPGLEGHCTRGLANTQGPVRFASRASTLHRLAPLPPCFNLARCRPPAR